METVENATPVADALDDWPDVPFTPEPWVPTLGASMSINELVVFEHFVLTTDDAGFIAIFNIGPSLSIHMAHTRDGGEALGNIDRLVAALGEMRRVVEAAMVTAQPEEAVPA